MSRNKLLVLLLASSLTLAVAAATPLGARPDARDEPQPLYRSFTTKHEGTQRYRRHWNFWVRIGGEVKDGSARIWPGYDEASEAVDALLAAMEAPRSRVSTEREYWRRIGIVWSWWRRNVRVDNEAYRTVRTRPDGWPSADDYGRYFARHGKLVCAACFSKAHLFATILGRIAYPRERIALAYAHHTESGAPKTASHVYVAVYVAGRWFYVDPTHAWSTPFPAFAQRRSLGPPEPNSIDYAHPFKVTPVPGSRLGHVPYLGDRGP